MCVCVCVVCVCVRVCVCVCVLCVFERACVRVCVWIPSSTCMCLYLWALPARERVHVRAMCVLRIDNIYMNRECIHVYSV